MRIEFERDGGVTFILSVTDEPGKVVKETIPWVEALRVGNELTSRAKVVVLSNVANITLKGTASVRDRNENDPVE